MLPLFATSSIAPATGFLTIPTVSLRTALATRDSPFETTNKRSATMRTSRVLYSPLGLSARDFLPPTISTLSVVRRATGTPRKTTVASPSAIQSKDKAMFSPFLLKVSFPPAESFLELTFSVNPPSVACLPRISVIWSTAYPASASPPAFLARATSLALLRAFCASLPAFNSAE